DPPTSTEQILHPQKYLDGDHPRTVKLPDLLPVLLVAAVALPKSLRPERREEIGLKQAGLWLREHAPGEPVAGAEKVAYYADVVQFKVPRDPALVPAHMDEIRARWLALVEDDHRGLASRLGPEFTIVAVFGEGDDRVSVIRYSP
ncbi:MAG: hypothetical protein HUU15_15555, partial [Candidatus Brocadiae bacterium]|nr:hypothetical protein [Candidatus Brocadiia bacterium]